MKILREFVPSAIITSITKDYKINIYFLLVLIRVMSDFCDISRDAENTSKEWIPLNHFSCRSSHCRCSVRKDVRKNFVKFTERHFCQSFFFFKKDSGTGVSLRICKIFRNTCFIEYLWTTTSIAGIVYGSL